MKEILIEAGQDDEKRERLQHTLEGLHQSSICRVVHQHTVSCGYNELRAIRFEAQVIDAVGENKGIGDSTIIVAEC